jgi:hypothetical protein
MPVSLRRTEFGFGARWSVNRPEGLLKAKGRRARIPGEGPACSTPKGEPGGPYGAPKVVSVSGRVATSQRIPLACP